MEVIDQVRFHGMVLNVWDNPDEPLFMVREVSEALYGYTQQANILRMVPSEEVMMCKFYTSGQNRYAKFITYEGLYEALRHSRLPQANIWFRAIRKTVERLRKEQGLTPVQHMKQLEEDTKEYLYDSKNRVWGRTYFDEKGEEVFEEMDWDVWSTEAAKADNWHKLRDISNENEEEQE